MKFPSRGFEAFLAKHSVSPDIYDNETPKYFHCQKPDPSDAAFMLPETVSMHQLCPDFYRTSPSFQFSTSNLYRTSQLLPMDLSSGIAVGLLELKPTDHVLDLCCAPGGKLVLAGLQTGRGFDPSIPGANGILTGVDLAMHRLATTRSMLKKYQIPRARLFAADGAAFDERPICFAPSGTESSLQPPHAKPFHCTTALRKRPIVLAQTPLYDKVLVDAQCTHDGSIKHIRKHARNDWKDFEWTQFDPEPLEKLHALQLRLLLNGFRLLKPGGILIYSTCSFSTDQNEGIVRQFLDSAGSAARALPFAVGSVPSDALAQLRFDPNRTDLPNTGGFFIFRATKVATE